MLDDELVCEVDEVDVQDLLLEDVPEEGADI